MMSRSALRMLARVWPSVQKPACVVSLGYPDCFATAAEFFDLLGLPYVRVLSEEASRKARKLHGSNTAEPVPDMHDVFERMGGSLRVWDLAVLRGREEVVDLNGPFPVEPCSVDVILDLGTLEHVWNMGAAMQRCAVALRRGGIIIHIHPLTMMNHGYWSPQPRTYRDFYQANGFDLLALKGVMRGTEEPFDLPLSRRAAPDKECMTLVMARKTNDATQAHHPMELGS